MYLDPGFGGMLLQVLVAVVAAGGIALFSLRKKIRALFSKNKNEKQPEKPASASQVADKDVIDTLSGDEKS